MLKLHAYSSSCKAIYSGVRKAIKALDPSSGDWRIICGSRKQAPEPLFFLSANVVGNPGEFHWIEVLRLAETLIGVTTDERSVDQAKDSLSAHQTVSDEPLCAVSAEISSGSEASTDLVVDDDEEEVPLLEDWEHLPDSGQTVCRPDPKVPGDSDAFASRKQAGVPLQATTIADVIVRYTDSLGERARFQSAHSHWFNAVLNGIVSRQEEYSSFGLAYLIRKKGAGPGHGPAFGFAGRARIRQEFLFRFWRDHAGPPREESSQALRFIYGEAVGGLTPVDTPRSQGVSTPPETGLAGLQESLSGISVDRGSSSVQTNRGVAPIPRGRGLTPTQMQALASLLELSDA